MLMGSRTALLPIGMRLDEPTKGDEMRLVEPSPIIRTGVIHTLKVADRQAVIILMIPVHAGNDNEYLVRFDNKIVGQHHKRFKTLDAAKLYATQMLFGSQ